MIVFVILFPDADTVLLRDVVCAILNNFVHVLILVMSYSAPITGHPPMLATVL